MVDQKQSVLKICNAWFPPLRRRYSGAVLPLPEFVIPFPFREQATELDGNHFP